MHALAGSSLGGDRVWRVYMQGDICLAVMRTGRLNFEQECVHRYITNSNSSSAAWLGAFYSNERQNHVQCCRQTLFIALRCSPLLLWLPVALHCMLACTHAKCMLAALLSTHLGCGTAADVYCTGSHAPVLAEYIHAAFVHVRCLSGASWYPPNRITSWLWPSGRVAAQAPESVRR